MNFTYRPLVSLARLTLCWWRHNRLMMTPQWPDNCDAITWIMISTSLDIDLDIFTAGRVRNCIGSSLFRVMACRLFDDICFYRSLTYDPSSGLDLGLGLGLEAFIVTDRIATYVMWWMMPVFKYNGTGRMPRREAIIQMITRRCQQSETKRTRVGGETGGTPIPHPLVTSGFPSSPHKMLGCGALMFNLNKLLNKQSRGGWFETPWRSCHIARVVYGQCVLMPYGHVIMGTIASQIIGLMIVYSIVYSDADQRKHQSSASLAFVRRIHRGPVNSPHKWPVTRKLFPFDDVIM